MKSIQWRKENCKKISTITGHWGSLKVRTKLLCACHRRLPSPTLSHCSTTSVALHTVSNLLSRPIDQPAPVIPISDFFASHTLSFSQLWNRIEERGDMGRGIQPHCNSFTWRNPLSFQWGKIEQRVLSCCFFTSFCLLALGATGKIYFQLLVSRRFLYEILKKWMAFGPTNKLSHIETLDVFRFRQTGKNNWEFHESTSLQLTILACLVQKCTRMFLKKSHKKFASQTGSTAGPRKKT